MEVKYTRFGRLVGHCKTAHQVARKSVLHRQEADGAHPNELLARPHRCGERENSP